MESQSSGQRPLTLPALRARGQSLDTYRTVSRRELSAAARDAANALKLRPAVRATLSELCAVWGEQAWARLLVWPSNQHLSARTGLSERAVRYALADLIRLELVAPKDSANGKRYAIRDAAGTLVDAYGFDLTPVVARAGEWVACLAERRAREAHRRHSFDLLTCARRDVENALQGLKSAHPEIDVSDLVRTRAGLEEYTPKRARTGEDPEFALQAWLELRELCEHRYFEAGCGGKSCSHIETDNGSPENLCSKTPPVEAALVRSSERVPVPMTPEIVFEACPAARAFAGGEAGSIEEVIAIGRDLRGAIGAHQSAWAEACESLGRLRAALLVILVVQLHDDDVARGTNTLKNPGGYFRQLVRLTHAGRYSIEAELLAMRRRRMT